MVSTPHYPIYLQSSGKIGNPYHTCPTLIHTCMQTTCMQTADNGFLGLGSRDDMVEHVSFQRTEGYFSRNFIINAKEVEKMSRTTTDEN